MGSHGPMSDAYKEYKDFVNSVNDSSQKDDVYNELMQKETNVLNTINRVAETELSKKNNTNLFYNKSLIEIAALFANTWANIFTELINEDMYKQPMQVFWNGDRKIHVGLMIVLVSIFLFFIQISK
jgi:hypothetical protein